MPLKQLPVGVGGVTRDGCFCILPGTSKMLIQLRSDSEETSFVCHLMINGKSENKGIFVCIDFSSRRPLYKAQWTFLAYSLK